MILRDKILIEASQEEIWPYISHLNQLPAWNPKIVKIEPVSIGSEHVGYNFNVTYKMKKDRAPKSFHGQIVDYQFSSQIRFVYREVSPEKPADANRQTYEEYILRPPTSAEERSCFVWRGLQRETSRLESNKKPWTICEQIITMSDSGIPVFFRMLIWFVMKFGKPKGETHLEMLRRLVLNLKP